MRMIRIRPATSASPRLSRLSRRSVLLAGTALAAFAATLPTVRAESAASGPPRVDERAGGVIVGARRPLIAFNVNLRGDAAAADAKSFRQIVRIDGENINIRRRIAQRIG